MTAAGERDTTPTAPRRREDILSTLQRGLRLLELLAEHGSALSARELASLLGIRLGACYRVLRTLEHEDFVTRLPGGGYMLGGRIASLETSLRTYLTPDPALVEILEELHTKLGRVSLNTWQGKEIVLSDARGKDVIPTSIGYREAAHARAPTKAILSYLPRQKIRQFFVSRKLEQLTPHTITSIDRLLDDLQESARRGYAIDREETWLGYYGVGVPIFGRSCTPVAAFAAATTTAEFASRIDSLYRTLADAAELASRRLGYTGPYPPLPSQR